MNVAICKKPYKTLQEEMRELEERFQEFACKGSIRPSALPWRNASVRKIALFVVYWLRSVEQGIGGEQVSVTQDT